MAGGELHPALMLAPRAAWVVLLGLVGSWVGKHLGGVAVGVGDGTDTSRLFNWHPVLMTLAFGGLMTEGLLAFRGHPLVVVFAGPQSQRAAAKRLHGALHGLAALCIALGLLSVFQSHNLKKPKPMPNLYSAHSFLGLAAVALFGLQALAGFLAYAVQAPSPEQRRALLPVHRALGYCAWVVGIIALATGVQEKQGFSMGDDKYAPSVRIAGLVLLALAATFVTTSLVVLLPGFRAADDQGGAAKRGQLLDNDGGAA
jgi:hypothetical protein